MENAPFVKTATWSPSRPVNSEGSIPDCIILKIVLRIANGYIFEETCSALNAFINFRSAYAAYICVPAWHDYWIDCMSIELFIADHAVKG